MGNMGNIFDGATIAWGFTPADIIVNAGVLLGTLAGFVLLGLAFYFTPKIIDLVKGAAK